MKIAVGTSLLIIATKSLIGFLGDIGQQAIDWNFLAIFTTLSVAGIFLGSYLTRFIPGEKLKRLFGWFVLGLSLIHIYVACRLGFLKTPPPTQFYLRF